MRAAAWTLLALLAGLVLASLPFLHFMSGHGPHDPEVSDASHVH